jgi:hypothetical protein
VSVSGGDLVNNELNFCQQHKIFEKYSIHMDKIFY